jgi:phosphoribosylformylglycinamidine cyclo-ligase
MGHRMEVYADPSLAEQIIAISKSFNVDAKIIGRVEKAEARKVSIQSPFGKFEYC